MNLNRKTILMVGIAGVALYFAKGWVEKRAVEKYRQNAGGATAVSNARLEKIKVKVFELIENVHYKYKSDVMSEDDIRSYEQIVNHVVS